MSRKTKYSRWTGFDWSDLDLTEVVKQLSDHFLESGFQKQFQQQLERWLRGNQEGRIPPEDPLNELRKAVAKALLESEILDTQQLEQLFSDSGEPKDERLAQLIDQLISRLLEEGYISAEADGETLQWEIGADGRLQLSSGQGTLDPARDIRVEFSLTSKGSDFLGYLSLRSMLEGFGSGGVGAHQTQELSAGVEAYQAPKPYEFGDALQLDTTATLRSVLKRSPDFSDFDYSDLYVKQSERGCSCATVLMLDCSHSMILYGEDRFTPAKKIALALAHLITTSYPGDSLHVVLFHDGAEEVPLARLANVQVGPYHTNTREGLKLARRILSGQRQQMRQIMMITDGKPSAIFLGDTFEVDRDTYGRKLYKNSNGLDKLIVEETLKEASLCRRSGVLLNTFMITEDPYLIRFVEMMTQVAEGKAYFAGADNVGRFVVADFMKGRGRTLR